MKLSLDEFIDLLPLLESRMRIAAQEALEQAAKLVVDATQAKIGGDTDLVPLSPSTIEDKVREGLSEEPLQELRDSYDFRIQGLTASIGSEAKYAEFQEVGTDVIPPRPLLLPSVYDNEKAIEKIIGQGVVDALSGKTKQDV